ncbi:hypothetical protein FGADI_8983 [Fusarium gaditjirri]|uniref:GH16 domain-containing protein n=1 Tax=Fusarium gaditjirri TaxID=282569 RepID=A0A8H4T149_9HYPO|nr:hypothetical protein FGADI_8983 [Fusarium gaditjirri]
MLFFTVILCFLAATSIAYTAPEIAGYQTVWSDSFEGSAGSLPDTSKWDIQEWYKDLNGDYQEYRASPENVHVTGNGFLRIMPMRDPSATKGWTSGRIESKYTFTPTPGTKTIIQGIIRLGNAHPENKKGIWPALWLLGDSHRTGGPIWPECGELDIMEHVNGQTTTHAAVHCDKAPGGICNEKTGIAKEIFSPDAGKDWHTYRVVIDRTPTDWKKETVEFWVDDQHVMSVNGARIGNPKVWASIAHNKMFVILNVAVGGDWPQPPREDTAEGLGVGMEVGYVAHYVQDIPENDIGPGVDHYDHKGEDLRNTCPDLNHTGPPPKPEPSAECYPSPAPDYTEAHDYGCNCPPALQVPEPQPQVSPPPPPVGTPPRPPCGVSTPPPSVPAPPSGDHHNYDQNRPSNHYDYSGDCEVCNRVENYKNPTVR